MKIPLILFILLLNHWVVVSSQSLERTVIAASGGHMRNASLSLDWTLGEPVIDLRYNSKIVLSQGFQQANNSELGAFYSPPHIEGRCDACGGRLRHRADDNEEIIGDRLRVYETHTIPVIEYYKGQEKLRTVQGVGEVESVSRRNNFV